MTTLAGFSCTADCTTSAEAYTERFLCPLAEETEAVFIILPHLFSFITFAVSQAMKKGALRSISISLSQSSSVHSTAGFVYGKAGVVTEYIDPTKDT